MLIFPGPFSFATPDGRPGLQVLMRFKDLLARRNGEANLGRRQQWNKSAFVAEASMYS